ncbi:MAG: hypothetical protein NTU84_11225 [Verrucomicrobia bacterium]|nr:hypothetical protein [Verrucomicrobiota bacterium]
MSPALAEISAAITSALKVLDGCFCMRRIILGGGDFAASMITHHMCFRTLQVASIGTLGDGSQKIGIFMCFSAHGLLPISSSIVIGAIDGSQHAATGIPMGLLATGFTVSGTGQRAAYEGGWRAYGMVHRGVQ